MTGPAVQPDQVAPQAQDGRSQALIQRGCLLVLRKEMQFPRLPFSPSGYPPLLLVATDASRARGLTVRSKEKILTLQRESVGVLVGSPRFLACLEGRGSENSKPCERSFCLPVTGPK